jgi:hypothetical protein
MGIERVLSNKTFLPSIAMLLAASWTSAAMAQPTADPWAPQPPFGAPGAQPGQPGGQPGAGQPGPAPGPGQPGQPVQPGAAPGSFGGEASAGGQVAPGQFGGAGASATGQFGGPPPSPNPKGSKDEDAWKARQLSLITQNGLSGGTGLLRTSFAGSGAAGTFRVGFVADWYTSSAFLCDPDESTEAGVPITCSGRNDEDSASHVGGFFSLNATPLPFLEAFASVRTYANSNDQGSPQLLQVLGDTTIGVKGFTPEKLLGPMQVGAEAQLLLLNGAGDVGPVGGATSALFRINGTFDARQIKKNIPIRINLNLGYKVDNSGAAVEAIEIARAQAFNDGRDRQPISRIERFGLGINRVDFFQTYLGVEVPFSFMQPFVEYTVDIPVNRRRTTPATRTASRAATSASASSTCRTRTRAAPATRPSRRASASAPASRRSRRSAGPRASAVCPRSSASRSACRRRRPSSRRSRPRRRGPSTSASATPSTRSRSRSRRSSRRPSSR